MDLCDINAYVSYVNIVFMYVQRTPRMIHYACGIPWNTQYASRKGADLSCGFIVGGHIDMILTAKNHRLVQFFSIVLTKITY